jgi:hypothetical protein
MIADCRLPIADLNAGLKFELAADLPFNRQLEIGNRK